MKTEMMGSKKMNIFDIPNVPMTEELTEILTQSKNVRIERVVSTGQVSPNGFWYDQGENEFVLLVQGEAVIGYENDQIKLMAGDTLFIPAHQKHNVQYTSTEPACIWVCVFYY